MKPFHAIVKPTKPIGLLCNLNCKYCFHPGKERLSRVVASLMA